MKVVVPRAIVVVVLGQLHVVVVKRHRHVPRIPGDVDDLALGGFAQARKLTEEHVCGEDSGRRHGGYIGHVQFDHVVVFFHQRKLGFPFQQHANDFPQPVRAWIKKERDALRETERKRDGLRETERKREMG